MIWSTKLSSGVGIHLETLEVTRTYRSLLEGVPDDAFNKDLLARASQHAGELHVGWPVHVVPPVIVEEPFPRLPAFCCIGYFKSFKAKTPGWDGSGLVIVWFQQNSPVNGVQLFEPDLDWFALARDYCY